MKRNWLQFRLRTLFILLTLAAVVTGVVQHVQYVRKRTQFHEAKLATCYDRLTMKVNVNSYFFLGKLNAPVTPPDFGPAESERIRRAIGDGYLLYAPEIRREVEFSRAKELVDEHMKEIARLEEAQRYHQRQAEAYRRAMWRPWMRVAEDRSQELGEVPPETAPVPPVFTPPRSTPQVPADASVPQIPAIPRRVRLPWQPIDRPFPADWERQDVETNKTDTG